MPTWGQHYAAEERTVRRAAADAALRARHAQFDLQAQDLHHKHDRPHFAVVGEGSRSAQDRYRANYTRIFGTSLPSRRHTPALSAVLPAPGVVAAG